MDRRVEAASDTWRLLALAGIALTVVLVPVFPRIHFGSRSLDVVTLTVPLAVLLSFPLLRREGALRLPHLSFEIPAMAFLAFGLVSVVFSASPLGSFATWLRYLSYIALVPVVGVVTRDRSARRLLLWLLAAAGAVTMMQGLLQYLNPTQGIGLEGLSHDVKTRVFASFGNPNFYAEYLVVLFAALLALVFSEGGALRWLAVVLLGADTLLLLLTYTRGSWLALAVAVVVAIAMVDARWIWGFAGAGALGALVVPGVLDRVVSIFSLEGTASFRLRLWRIAGTIIAAHAATGVGIGGYGRAFKEISVDRPDIAVDFLRYSAHNAYFALMAETGVLGGLAFAAVVLAICAMGAYYNARLRDDAVARLTNAALTVGLVAFAINALTSNSFQHPRAALFFWILAGLQVGLGDRVWAYVIEDAKTTDPRERAGIVRGSAVVHAALCVARSCQLSWRASELRRLLVVRASGGDMYARSRLVGLALGRGRGGPR